MKKPFLPLVWTCAAFACLFTSCVAFAETRDVTHNTYPMEGSCRLAVDADGVNISVSASDKPEAEVTITRIVRAGSKSGEEELLAGDKVSVEAEGGTLTISLATKRGVFVRSRDYRIEVKFPASGSADLKTSGGNVRVDGLFGAVEAHTSGGNVDLSHLGGPVKAWTSGGNVGLNDVAGSVEVGTSGGNIMMDGVKGPLQAKTNGGNVSARFSAQPKGDVHCSTSGGNVSISLPSGVACRVNAHTFGGGIHTDFPLSKPDHEYGSSTRQGDINGGGPLVELSTSGGFIHIEKNN